MSRDEMDEFNGELDVKLRCIARRLTDVQTKVEDDAGDAAAGTKKARCLSCDKVTRAQRTP